MDVRGLASRDYGELVNALREGPFVPAKVSFRVEWSASHDKHRFRYATRDVGSQPGLQHREGLVGGRDGRGEVRR
jgi:hypothetical protein